MRSGRTPIFDVPKHSEYVWDGVLIENHRTILNVRRNRTERELNAVLVRLLEKEGTHGLAPGIQAPRATFNAIFLIRHAAVHFQKEGIVLRHLCDWACFPDTALGRDRPCTVPHGDGGLPHGQVR